MDVMSFTGASQEAFSGVSPQVVGPIQ